MLKFSGLVSTASLLQECLEVRAVLKPDFAKALADEGGKDPRYRTTLEGFSQGSSFVLQPDQVQVKWLNKLMKRFSIHLSNCCRL